ncbi:MAG TPA: sigma-70 family RNA polymerase sigma factor, partial [Planctomycetota bacterium]|nr:sigma-70 family RNA polymerase sigma factor [Planctomycetota bacterium]
MTEDADLELVLRARSGDYEAFEVLVGRYERRLHALAVRIVRNSEDAKDVVQETLLSAIEHLPEFRGEATFQAWILRIATNHALKILRKRRGLNTVPLEEGTQGLPLPQYIATWRDEPERLAQDDQVRKLLDQALDELDPNYRTVFVLRDLEGLSTAEAARAIGISEGNVKVRLLRARLQLRERLTRELGLEATRMSPAPEHG